VIDAIAVIPHPTLGNGELAGRLALAVALGGAIGLEREISDQPAGLRTHISVALGATLFGIISTVGFNAFLTTREASDYQIDVTRVASQVVVGIGFLGAGAIVKEGLSIRGLTTAASLWVTAAIGLAVGIGGYAMASLTTVALLVSLVGLRGPRRLIRQRIGRVSATIAIRLQPGADPGPVMAAVSDIDGLDVSSVNLHKRDDGDAIFAQVKTLGHADVTALVAPLAERPEVASVDVD
jgi:putative Mg2+ transporter-C (MgtC) family protein